MDDYKEKLDDIFDLKIGDTVYTGKFRNRPAEIKGFSKDEKGQPIVALSKINNQP